jgi:hypothetical protein
MIETEKETSWCRQNRGYVEVDGAESSSQGGKNAEVHALRAWGVLGSTYTSQGLSCSQWIFVMRVC